MSDDNKNSSKTQTFSIPESFLNSLNKFDDK